MVDDRKRTMVKSPKALLPAFEGEDRMMKDNGNLISAFAGIVLLGLVPTFALSDSGGPRMEWLCEGEETLSGMVPLAPMFNGSRLTYEGHMAISRPGQTHTYLYTDVMVTKRPSGISSRAAGICGLGFAIKDSRGQATWLSASLRGGPRCSLTMPEGEPLTLYAVHPLPETPVDMNPQFVCTAKFYLPAGRTK
jgi:hypothetical protein